jgi:capsular polysaccharide biosynthesis protein
MYLERGADAVNNDTARLSIIWHVLRQRWRLLFVIAVLGALIGAGASLLFSPGYETSASVLLQGSRESKELLTEAQVAKSSIVLDRAATALRWGVSGTDLADQVDAAVADGNIIAITGVADTPQRAQQLADRVAQEYVTFSTQLMANTTDASAQVSQEQRQTLRQQILETNQKISDLHAAAGQGTTIESAAVRTELESLRTALSDAVSKLDELDGFSGEAKMVVMGAAELPVGPAAPNMTHFVAGGALLGFLFGLFGHLFSAKSDRRLRDEKQISAALGSPSLGGIDVPAEEQATDAAPTGPGARLRRLVLADDKPWYLPTPPPAADETGLDIRYRRICSRLREHLPAGPARVMAVVPNDDPAAHRVAIRLGRVATGDRVGLRVYEVAADQPIVPEDSVAGVIVVATAHTRTAWELVGLTEACADAGLDVLGVVVATVTQPVPASRPQAAPDPVLAGAS